MDVQVHTFLIYLIAMTIVSAAFEMARPNDVRPALFRAGFTLLQGEKRIQFPRNLSTM